MLWRFVKFPKQCGSISKPLPNQIDVLEIWQNPQRIWKHLQVQTSAQSLINSPRTLEASSNFHKKTDQCVGDFSNSRRNLEASAIFHTNTDQCVGDLSNSPTKLAESSDFWKKIDQCFGDFSHSPFIWKHLQNFARRQINVLEISQNPQESGSIFRFLTDQCVRDFSNSPRNLEAYSVHCTLLTLDVSSKDNKILVVTVLELGYTHHKKKNSTSIFSRCFRCPNDIRNSNNRASIFNSSNRGGACHVHTSIIRKIKIQRFSANNSIYPPEAHILTLFPNSTWTLVKLFNRALESKKDGKSWDNYSNRAVWALVTAPKSICFLQNRLQLYEVAISWFWDFYWMATIPPPKYLLGRTEEPS